MFSRGLVACFRALDLVDMETTLRRPKWFQTTCFRPNGQNPILEIVTVVTKKALRGRNYRPRNAL